MTIRIGLIGAGVMGADHARLFSEEVPGASLQVICDADTARAKSVAEATAAHSIATDPLAVINSSEVDAVVIAAPDQFHASLTLACVAAGKPVLCEKPLSQDTRECLAILAAEEERGVRLVQVGFMRRFDPSYTEIKAILTRGDLGKALMFHCFHRNVSPAYDLRWRSAILHHTNLMLHVGCSLRISKQSLSSVHQVGAKPLLCLWCLKQMQGNS
jgi:myo-inositol 2-dehydrogenase / D-chiro-inositol 1-dehydrogenase